MFQQCFLVRLISKDDLQKNHILYRALNDENEKIMYIFDRFTQNERKQLNFQYLGTSTFVKLKLKTINEKRTQYKQIMFEASTWPRTDVFSFIIAINVG